MNGGYRRRTAMFPSGAELLPASQITHAENVRRWNEAAEEFASFFSDNEEFYHKHFINPSMLALLGDVRGRRVLDFACGEGHFARALADRAGRSVRILGLDASRVMIRIAREKNDGYARCIRYELGGVARLRRLRGASLDAAACNMGLQDIKDYRGTVREIGRLIRPGGWFVFSILHPCFQTPGAGWIKRDLRRTDNANRLGWLVDNYCARLAELWKIKSKMTSKVYYFHRTLGDYVRAVRDAGMVIADLREPVPTAAFLRKFPRFECDLRRGSFLVVRCERPR